LELLEDPNALEGGLPTRIVGYVPASFQVRDHPESFPRAGEENEPIASGSPSRAPTDRVIEMLARAATSWWTPLDRAVGGHEMCRIDPERSVGNEGRPGDVKAGRLLAAWNEPVER
jgi:hypothetical protein